MTFNLDRDVTELPEYWESTNDVLHIPDGETSLCGGIDEPTAVIETDTPTGLCHGCLMEFHVDGEIGDPAKISPLINRMYPLEKCGGDTYKKGFDTEASPR